MVTYFLKNKGQFRICEDSLTSIVFDLLKYLPIEVFWRIIKNSLYQDKLPKISGDLISISFWDKWSAENTKNNKFVEPDVSIRFQEFDVIIEAKRRDKNQQYYEQMEKEIISYFNEYELDKQLYFIQCGGLQDTKNEQNMEYKNKQIVICKTDWSRLLTQIVAEKKMIEEVDYSQLNAYKRIFNDLIEGFAMHGFFRKIWLDSLEKQTITDTNINQLFSYAKQH